MSVWKEYSLGEVCRRLSSGKNITARDIHDVGQYVVFGGNGVRGYTTKSNFVGECAIIGRQGAYCGKVRYFHGEAWMSEHAVVAEAKPEHDSRFLACLLSTMNLGSLSGQAAQPGLSVKVLAEQKVFLPDGPTQRLVSEVVGSIDDHIENNRRRVEVLEEMARTIYREWFVKFRYPGHEDVPMVDSALGPIPEGWEVQPLAAIATVNGSSRKPGGDEVLRYLDISALSERHIGELEAIDGSSAPGRARRVVGPGDTVWATVRPNRRAHALLVAPNSDWIASTGLAVLTPFMVSPDFLFETSSATAFSDWLVGRATGSAYPAVRAKDFEEAPIVVPDAAVDAAFADKVSPMHELSWSLRNECSRLAALRDLLLPKLVTGQVDVSTLELDGVVAEQVAQ